MKEYLKKYFILRRHEMKITWKKMKQNKSSYLFLAPYAILFAVLYVVYSIWSSKQQGSHVNHSAHLWGALYGVVVTIIINPAVIVFFFQQIQNIPAF